MTEDVKNTVTADAFAVTSQELVKTLKGMRGDVFKLAVKGGLAALACVAGGMVIGGAIAGTAATVYGVTGLLFLGSCVGGAAIGTFCGVWGGKVVVGGMMEDVAMKHGIDIGDMTLRQLIHLVRKAKIAAPALEKPLALVEKGAGSARKGFGVLRKFFGSAATPAPANDTTQTAKPAEQQKLKA